MTGIVSHRASSPNHDRDVGSGEGEIPSYFGALEPFGITGAQALVAPLMVANWPYPSMGKRIERTAREARRRCNCIRRKLHEHGLAAANKWEAGQTIARIVEDHLAEKRSVKEHGSERR